MEDTVTKYSHTYISPSACTMGDYGGSGTIGKSNIRTILAMAEEKEWNTDCMSYSTWNRIGGYYERTGDGGEVFEGDDPPIVVEIYGSYGSRTLYLLECEQTADIIAALADYPLLDDCDHSQCEMEAELEAWDSWLRSDLLDTLDDDDHPAHELMDDDLFAAYRAAMESTNTYPVHETGGCYVDVKRIAAAFAFEVAA